jgi:hypothetical protein
MDSIIIKPKNKNELNLLKSLFKKMDINMDIIEDKESGHPKKQLRPYALSKGKLIVEETFNDPLPDEILKTFYK